MSNLNAGQGSSRPPPPQKPLPPDKWIWVLKLLALIIVSQIAYHFATGIACGALNFMQRPIPPACPANADRMNTTFQDALKILLSLLGGLGLK